MSRITDPKQTEKLCKICGKILPIEEFLYGGKYRHLCKEHYAVLHKTEMKRQNAKPRTLAQKISHAERQRGYQRELRREVLSHYGGTPPICACCGESHLEFLALDHKFGGGEKHRKEVGSTDTMYRWAKKNGFPTIFRVLCHNCNSAFGYYGYCPHNITG